MKRKRRKNVLHLELAGDLTAETMILVLKRFISRRGYPVEIFSDNGKQFVAADKILAEKLKNLDEQKIGEFLTKKHIKWNFTPPYAPHMGGAWERLIKSVKTALKVTLKMKAPSEETLYTSLVEIENVINARPLTHISLNHEDDEILTPNHFLIGCSNAEIVHLPSVNKEIKKGNELRKQWETSQMIADLFWKQWLKVFIPSLVQQTKWFTEEENLKVNDVVLMLDKNLPRNNWKKAVIEQVFPSRDGRVRDVVVVAGGKAYRRPVSQLCKVF